MDNLTMIETLRERADISYEEAREVLAQAGDDLLEAIVLLEKQGKIKTGNAAKEEPAADETILHASADEKVRQEAAGGEIPEKETAETAAEEKKSSGSFGMAVKKVFHFILHTTFHVSRQGKELFAMPTWLPAILLPTFWGFFIPAILISLFFEVRYSFSGDADVETANSFFSKAGSFVDGVESGLQKEA